MIRKVLNPLNLKNSSKQLVHIGKTTPDRHGGDLRLTRRLSSKISTKEEEECDVCIIGGGAMGASTAFWLKGGTDPKEIERLKDLRVTVVEKNYTYRDSTTARSLGGVRQQFSLKENILLSMFGYEFVSEAQKHLKVPGNEKPDLNFRKSGYLFVACTDEGAGKLQANVDLQRSLGAKVEILSPRHLKDRFPCFNVDDVKLASIGFEREGSFDPWCFLNAMKKKAQFLGANFVSGNVTGFDDHPNPPVHISNGPNVLRFLNNETGVDKKLKFSKCVIAAGGDSGNVALLAGIGIPTSGSLGIKLPVEPKKRFVYCVHCKEDIQDNFPTLIDASGAYLRMESSNNHFICGQSPPDELEPNAESLEDIDYEFFERTVWPNLVKRVPCFANSKVQSAWAGYYDYNTMDQNGVIGRHPVYTNIIFATGFSGHGIQQAAGVGRAIKELLIDGSYLSIDLTSFGFGRFIRDKPIFEQNII